MKTIVHFLHQWYPVLLAFVCLFYSVGLGLMGHTEEALYSAHWAGTILLFSIAIRQRRITRSWAFRCLSQGLWSSPFTWFLWFGTFSMATNQNSTQIRWITNRTILMRMAWEISLDSQRTKRNEFLLMFLCCEPFGQNQGHKKKRVFSWLCTPANWAPNDFFCDHEYTFVQSTKPLTPLPY